MGGTHSRHGKDQTRELAREDEFDRDEDDDIGMTPTKTCSEMKRRENDNLCAEETIETMSNGRERDDTSFRNRRQALLIKEKETEVMCLKQESEDESAIDELRGGVTANQVRQSDQQHLQSQMLDGSNRQLRESLDASVSKVNALEATLATTESRCNVLDRALSASNSRIETAAAKALRLEKELKEKILALNHSDKKVQELEDRECNLESEIKRLREDCAEIQERLGASVSRGNKLAGDLAAAKWKADYMIRKQRASTMQVLEKELAATKDQLRIANQKLKSETMPGNTIKMEVLEKELAATKDQLRIANQKLKSEAMPGNAKVQYVSPVMYWGSAAPAQAARFPMIGSYSQLVNEKERALPEFMKPTPPAYSRLMDSASEKTAQERKRKAAAKRAKYRQSKRPKTQAQQLLSKHFTFASYDDDRRLPQVLEDPVQFLEGFYRDFVAELAKNVAGDDDKDDGVAKEALALQRLRRRLNAKPAGEDMIFTVPYTFSRIAKEAATAEPPRVEPCLELCLRDESKTTSYWPEGSAEHTLLKACLEQMVGNILQHTRDRVIGLPKLMSVYLRTGGARQEVLARVAPDDSDEISLSLIIHPGELGSSSSQKLSTFYKATEKVRSDILSPREAVIFNRSKIHVGLDEHDKPCVRLLAHFDPTTRVSGAAGRGDGVKT